jgi:hypothetical protein
MMSMIDRRAISSHFTFEQTNPVFDLSTEDVVLFEALNSKTAECSDAFDSAKVKLPLPTSANVSIEGHFYRLPGHNRSFCYSLAQSDAVFDSPVFVFKGTEPLLSDYPVLLAWMAQAPLRRSTRVMTDHFPLAEGKIPGALSLREALHEAEIALELQRKHLKHYGELAKLPTPLLVHRYPDDRVKTCAAHLRSSLSPTAFDRIEPLLAAGLAVYVYHYPAPPIRANYWGGMVSPSLTQYLKRHFTEEIAISGWATLTIRLLYLGYLPYTVRNDGLGACMDLGNATLDGGFCDPDSITPLETSPDDEFFRDGVVQSVRFLQSTTRLLLGLSHQPDLYSSIDEFVCGQYVLYLLSEAVKSEARPGLQMDARVLQLITPRTASDVRTCTARANRLGSYAHFLKKSGASIHPGEARIL